MPAWINTSVKPKRIYEQSMLKVAGKPFRCQGEFGEKCGCNVFTHEVTEDIYTCNACGARYRGVR